MKRQLLNAMAAALIFTAAASKADADQAVVTLTKGKVEVSRNGGWIPLKTGDTVAEDETISTGFQSEVRIKYNDSVMLMGALTRVTLEQMNSSGKKDNVNIYLSTGAVRSKITPTKDKKVNYTVRNPVAVASVRGTDYITTAGGTVKCLEGAVAVYSARQYERQLRNSAKNQENDSPDDDMPPDGNQEHANSNTAAENIAPNAPAGTIVVGKNQTTDFGGKGNPMRPMNIAAERIGRLNSLVKTDAEKEKMPMGGPAAARHDSDAPRPVPASVNVNIKIGK